MFQQSHPQTISKFHPSKVWKVIGTNDSQQEPICFSTRIFPLWCYPPPSTRTPRLLVLMSSGLAEEPFPRTFQFRIISLWISEPGKHMPMDPPAATSRSLQLNIHDAHITAGLFIQRNDQHCHSGTAAPSAEMPTGSDYIRPVTDDSAEETNNNKLTPSGLEGGKTGQRRCKIRDKCYGAS